ncbi:cation transporter, partial [Klebsiella pneumoniae]|uniref:cation transporter n=1 Tax=Klebsiella pneumoniae TaxID=573 RepID=UPI0028F7C7B5
MAHSHSHSSVQAPDNSNARRLLWAFIVTAGFMLIEAVGGAISGSLALLADAGHMLTDSAALLFALLAVVVILTTGWTPVDPILSVLVSCLVLRSAWRLLKESLNELL